jgi:hypothetical protein
VHTGEPQGWARHEKCLLWHRVGYTLVRFRAGTLFRAIQVDSIREKHESQRLLKVFELGGIFLDYDPKAEFAKRFDIEHL